MLSAMSLLLTSWIGNIFTSLITLAILGYVYFTWNFNHWEKRGIKFLSPTVIFGNFKKWALLRTDIGGMFSDLYQKSKSSDIVGIWIFRKPALLVVSPELIKSILVKNFNHFTDRTTYTDKEQDPLGSHSLFFAKNPDWKLMRSKLTHVFTSAKLKSMVIQMNDIGRNLQNCIAKQMDKPIDVKDICTRYDTDVIAKTAYGLDGDTLLDTEAPFNVFRRNIHNINFLRSVEFMSIFFMQGLAKCLKSKIFNTYSADWLRNIIWKTIKEREQKGEVRNDLIGALINLKNKSQSDGITNFTGDRLVAQAAMFFTGVGESSSSTTGYCLYHVAMNKEIQKKLAGEIYETLKLHESKITYEAINEMPYLDKCVKETIRMYPAVPFLSRECTIPYHVPDSNVVIEKGTNVYIPVMGIQNDESYFKDPETFRPERFDSNSADNIQPYTYLPFGEGPRSCIGEKFGLLRIKMCIISILKNFQVEICDETQIPLQREALSFAPSAKNGIYLKFTKREKEF